ncbi:hypothetical protein CLAIMM_14178, partial [Cladophialophora immunda]
PSTDIGHEKMFNGRSIGSATKASRSSPCCSFGFREICDRFRSIRPLSSATGLKTNPYDEPMTATFAPFLPISHLEHFVSSTAIRLRLAEGQHLCAWHSLS